MNNQNNDNNNNNNDNFSKNISNHSTTNKNENNKNKNNFVDIDEFTPDCNLKFMSKKNTTSNTTSPLPFLFTGEDDNIQIRKSKSMNEILNPEITNNYKNNNKNKKRNKSEIQEKIIKIQNYENNQSYENIQNNQNNESNQINNIKNKDEIKKQMQKQMEQLKLNSPSTSFSTSTMTAALKIPKNSEFPCEEQFYSKSPSSFDLVNLNELRTKTVKSQNSQNRENSNNLYMSSSCSDMDGYRMNSYLSQNSPNLNKNYFNIGSQNSPNLNKNYFTIGNSSSVDNCYSSTNSSANDSYLHSNSVLLHAPRPSYAYELNSVRAHSTSNSPPYLCPNPATR